jgi:hypothetical protein
MNREDFDGRFDGVFGGLIEVHNRTFSNLADINTANDYFRGIARTPIGSEIRRDYDALNKGGLTPNIYLFGGRGVLPQINISSKKRNITQEGDSPQIVRYTSSIHGDSESLDKDPVVRTLGEVDMGRQTSILEYKKSKREVPAYESILEVTRRRLRQFRQDLGIIVLKTRSSSGVDTVLKASTLRSLKDYERFVSHDSTGLITETYGLGENWKLWVKYNTIDVLKKLRLKV